jgi:hypothetical protein
MHRLHVKTEITIDTFITRAIAKITTVITLTMDVLALVKQLEGMFMPPKLRQSCLFCSLVNAPPMKIEITIDTFISQAIAKTTTFIT